MLIIPQTQLNAFDGAARAQFLDEVTVLFNKAHNDLINASGEPIEPAPLTAEDREVVEELAQKAESFGLREHESIGVFLQAAFLIGTDFYAVFRPVNEVLRSALLDESTKRGWLEKWFQAMVYEDESEEDAGEDT